MLSPNLVLIFLIVISLAALWLLASLPDRSLNGRPVEVALVAFPIALLALALVSAAALFR